MTVAVLLGVRGLHNPAAGRVLAAFTPPASAGGAFKRLPFGLDFMLLSYKVKAIKRLREYARKRGKNRREVQAARLPESQGA